MRRIDLMSRFLLGLHRLRRTGSFGVRGSVPPKTLTGAEYVRQITSPESDRWRYVRRYDTVPDMLRMLHDSQD
jgi:hypothetical protein